MKSGGNPSFISLYFPLRLLFLRATPLDRAILDGAKSTDAQAMGYRSVGEGGVEISQLI